MTVPTGYSGTNLTTALSTIYADVGRDFETGAVTANSGLMADVADLNTETGAIDRAIISALDLKAKKQDDTYEAITDLSSVYADNTKTLYSGLNQRVSDAENTLSSEVNLMSRIATTDSNNELVMQADALAGIAGSVEVTGKIATAKSSVLASIDKVCAGIGVAVTKDSNGDYKSVASISADNINLNGQTNFINAVGTSLETKFATVGSLNTLSITVGDVSNAASDAATAASNAQTSANNAQTTADNAQTTASNANAEFIRLANGNGTFTGNVNAKTLIAGDPNGINIRTSQDRIEFCQGGDIRAYFVANGKGM